MKRLEFSRKTKLARWTFAGGKCEAVWDGKRCNAVLTPAKVEYHHDKEAEAGGDNSFENCRCVCVTPCHKLLTAAFVKGIRKADRQRANHIGARLASPKPIRSAGFAPSKKVVAREARGPKIPLPERRSLYR